MANKKRVLFLYNGGTIGLVAEKHDGQTVLMPPKDSKVFQDACEPTIAALGKEMEITFEFVTAKDSSNMTPNDWEKLIFRIKKAQDEIQKETLSINIIKKR